MVKERRRQSNIFPISMLILLIMFFVRDVMGINIPFFVYVCELAIFYTFYRKVDFLALGCVMPLFTHGLQTYLVLGIALIFYLFKNRTVTVKRTLGLFIVLLIYEALHYFVFSFEIGEYFRYAVVYIYIGYMIGENDDILPEDCIWILKQFVIVYLAVMIVIYSQMISLVGFENTVTMRFGSLTSIKNGSYVGLYDNANMLALFSILSIGCCGQCLNSGERKAVWVSMMAITLFFGLLTQSKAFLLCVALFVLMETFAVLSKKNVSFGRKMLTVFALSALFVCLYVFVLKDYFNVIVERFGQTDDLLSGRDSVFSGYHNYLMHNPLVLFFGTGLQNVGVCGVTNSPHNAVQETVVCFGLLGAIVVLSIIFSIFRVKGIHKKYTLYSLITAILYFGFIQSIQFFRMTSIALLLLLVYVSINICNDKMGCGNNEFN